MIFDACVNSVFVLLPIIPFVISPLGSVYALCLKGTALGDRQIVYQFKGPFGSS